MFRTRFLQVVAVGAVCLHLTYGAEASLAPIFNYNAQTGIVSLQAEPDPGTTLVSWIIEGPEATDILAFQDGTSSEGSNWIQGYFDGKEQWIAITGDGVYGTWDLAMYPTGLDLSAFGQVEYGLRYSSGEGVTGYTTVSASPTLTGDLDLDGFVGITDLNLVLSNWNLNVPPANQAADPSGDGFVGIEDLNTVLGNWNAGVPASLMNQVPEPALVWIVWLPMLLMRRHADV